MARRWYVFGPFRFDGELLYRNGTLIPLKPRAAVVLLLLIENRNHLVKKEDLRRACGHRVVDNTVDQAVCELRRYLGVGARAAKRGGATCIQTVPNRGYVFQVGGNDVLIDDEPPVEAERDYYEGLERWHQREPEAVLQARVCVNRALRREPRYARGYSFLADTHAVLGAYWWIAPHEAAGKALAAARRALDFDRELAEPHATIGFVRALFEQRWSEAAAHFGKCLDRAPDYGVGHHWLALQLAATGELAKATREIEEARRHDRSRSVDVHCGTIQYWSRDFREAERLCQSALEEHPDFWYAHYQMALVFEEQGRLREALQKQRDAVACVEGPAGLTLAALARTTALAGDRDQARRLLARASSAARSIPASFHVAAAYAALGDRDLAFAALDEACAAKDLWVSYVAVDPRMDGLRGDPRFAQVLDRLDLPHA